MWCQTIFTELSTGPACNILTVRVLCMCASLSIRSFEFPNQSAVLPVPYCRLVRVLNPGTQAEAQTMCFFLVALHIDVWGIDLMGVVKQGRPGGPYCRSRGCIHLVNCESTFHTWLPIESKQIGDMVMVGSPVRYFLRITYWGARTSLQLYGLQEPKSVDKFYFIAQPCDISFVLHCG